MKLNFIRIVTSTTLAAVGNYIFQPFGWVTQTFVNAVTIFILFEEIDRVVKNRKEK